MLMHGFNRCYRAHRHEDRCLNGPVICDDFARACAALWIGMLKCEFQVRESRVDFLGKTWIQKSWLNKGRENHSLRWSHFVKNSSDQKCDRFCEITFVFSSFSFYAFLLLPDAHQSAPANRISYQSPAPRYWQPCLHTPLWSPSVG